MLIAFATAPGKVALHPRQVQHARILLSSPTNGDDAARWRPAAPPTRSAYNVSVSK